jgi:hypothetical protein
MEKQIKDAFNEIHAPKDLIEDTKQKMHKLNDEQNHKTKPKFHHWKAVTGIASLAACAVIIIAGKQVFLTDSDKPVQDVVDLAEGENSLNTSENEAFKEFEFEGTKELSEWYQVLEDIKVNPEERTTLDGNYVIFTTDYVKDENEYQIDLLVERGELHWENNQLILQGTFKAKVSDEENILSESVLDIISSSQFTSKDAVLEMEDINEDGSPDFLLETIYNESSQWYTLDENNNITIVE